MISLPTAKRLKAAGLTWIPALHDYFAVPDRGMDDHVFVICDMMAFVEIRNQLPIVTFHGTAEWALDYILTQEIVWLPKEDQLRMAIMRYLSEQPGSSLVLSGNPEGYTLEIQYRGEQRSYTDREGSEVYAEALLDLLQS